MKQISGRSADPVYDTVLVPFDGSQLSAGAVPTVRDPLAHLAFGSGAGDIVQASSAPVLVVPASTAEP